MFEYIVHRFLLMILTLLAVAVIVFFLIRIIPGDIVELRFAEGAYVTEEMIEMEREKLGLNLPLWRQFKNWMLGILVFDFGTSMWTGKPITEELALRFELSLQVALMGTFLSAIIAIPLGMIAAYRQDTWVDYVIRVFSIGGLAIPSFWLGILMILFLLIFFKWMPPLIFVSFSEDPWQNLSQLIWPALSIGYRYSAMATRMTRSAMLEVLREDYIRTARAKGLKEIIILRRHAIKNAMPPVLTVIGLEFAYLIGGLVVTEQVFNLNGLGQLFVQSVGFRDYTIIQTLILLVAITYVLVNFIVDIFYAWLDPRIRYSS